MTDVRNFYKYTPKKLKGSMQLRKLRNLRKSPFLWKFKWNHTKFKYYTRINVVFDCLFSIWLSIWLSSCWKYLVYFIEYLCFPFRNLYIRGFCHFSLFVTTNWAIPFIPWNSFQVYTWQMEGLPLTFFWVTGNRISVWWTWTCFWYFTKSAILTLF